MSSTEKFVIRARDVMRAGLETVDGLATIKEAADKMRAEHISCPSPKSNYNGDYE